MSDEHPPLNADARLDSWKAIAAFLNRDVRTVMRWEKSEGLPVHRHRHQSGRSVYAYPAELDAWRAVRRAEPAIVQTAPRRRWGRLGAAFIVVVAIVAGGDGRFEGQLLIGSAGQITDHPLGWPQNSAMAADASMSADGRYVSFIDQDTDELGVKDLQTGHQWLLTRMGAAGGELASPAISRDDRYVAFACTESGSREAPSRLCVLPMDAPIGTAPRVLAQGQWFYPEEWSQDDHDLLVRVVRNHDRVEIGLVDVATGSYRPLRRFARPFPGDVVRRSPDGAFVAYDVAPTLAGGHRDIHLISTRDGADVVLLGGPSSDTVVGWSPDGSRLLFQSDRRGDAGLWALPIVNGAAAGEPRLVQGGFDAEPHTVTARGDLFYERAVGSTGGPPTRALMTATVEPAAGTMVTQPWYAARDREAANRFPRWSSDGASFLYLTYWSDGWVASIRSIETQQVREVPLPLSYIWTFDWSRDGQWLVFRAKDVAGRNGVFLIDAQTGHEELVAVAGDESFLAYRSPQFTADGKGLTFFRWHAGGAGAPEFTSYVRWDLATGTEQVLERAAPEITPGRYSLGRSPDGRFRLAAYVDLLRQPSGLFVYDTVTCSEREIFRTEQPNAINYEDGLQWMPDGRAVIINVRGAAPNAFELWWVPVDGRQPHGIDIGINNLVNSPIAINPDGRQISFVAGDPVPSTASSLQGEFRLLEHLLQEATKHDTR